MKARSIQESPAGNDLFKCDHCGNHFFQCTGFVVYTEYQFCANCNRHIFDPIVQFRLEELLLVMI